MSCPTYDLPQNYRLGTSVLMTLSSGLNAILRPGSWKSVTTLCGRIDNPSFNLTMDSSDVYRMAMMGVVRGHETFCEHRKGSSVVTSSALRMSVSQALLIAREYPLSCEEVNVTSLPSLPRYSCYVPSKDVLEDICPLGRLMPASSSLSRAEEETECRISCALQARFSYD